MLGEGRRWVMPGPDLDGRIAFYEDFPYAWWNDFGGLGDLTGAPLTLPQGYSLEARYAEIGEQMERKAAGIRVYASQIRKKLGPDAASMLIAEPGVGYRLTEPDEA